MSSQFCSLSEDTNQVGWGVIRLAVLIQYEGEAGGPPGGTAVTSGHYN